MLKRILVPLDGSERAERGLAVAARLARGAGAELLLLRVVSLPPMKLAHYGEPAQIALAVIAAEREDADAYLKRLAASPVVEGVSVEPLAIEGHVTADILDTAREEACDLIVICTHGYSGFNQWRLGRVASHVARHAPVPVLIVPARDEQPPAPVEEGSVRVLVTLDGSELAEAAIVPALDVAHAAAPPERIAIHLLEVVDFFTAMMADEERDKAESSAIGPEEQSLQIARGYLDTIVRRIQQEHPGVAVTSTAMLASDVAKTICTIADAHPGYDFVAMATHGRGGLQRWAVGSITERVLHAIHHPLLIARSSAAVEQDRKIAEAKAD